MKKTIPRETQKHVVMFNVAQGTVAATGNIAVHFQKVIEADEMQDVCKVEITKEMKEDSIWQDIQAGYINGLEAEANVAVVLPVERLLEVLHAVDTKLIKLEFLPALIPCDERQRNLVDGNKYIQSMKHVGGVDAMRVTEIPTPGKPDEAGDSACIMGALRVVTEWFKDPVKVQQTKDNRKELFRRLKNKIKKGG